MIKNKTSMLFAAGALALSMLACNLGKGPRVEATQLPEEPSSAEENVPVTAAPAEEVPAESASGACDNPYQPVITGASWNYKITGPVPDTFVRSILVVNEGGYTDQDVFGTGVTRESQWKCESGNLTALNPSGGGSSSISAEGVSVNFQTTELSGVTLPPTLTPGDHWEQVVTLEGTQEIGGSQVPARNHFTTTCDVIGIESVTVEAGTFDAMRFDCVVVMNISLAMEGSPIETTLTLTNVNWHVENIGLVKTATTSDTFNSTIELISYNIP